MIKISKRTAINIEANQKIKAMFIDKEIFRCEICPILAKLKLQKNPCLVFEFLSFAHRHKRIEYYKYPNMLYNFN